MINETIDCSQNSSPLVEWESSDQMELEDSFYSSNAKPAKQKKFHLAVVTTQSELFHSYQSTLDAVKIDYFIESAPYGFSFTSRKTLETNE